MMRAQRRIALATLAIAVVIPTVSGFFYWDYNTLVTLSDQSNIGPGMAWDTRVGKMFLAWIGTDPNHYLNVISSSDLITWSNKVTTTISATNGNWVGMTYDDANQKLYISYEFAPYPLSRNWYFYVTSSLDGISWSSPVAVASSVNYLTNTNGASIAYNPSSNLLVVAGNNVDGGGHDFVYQSMDGGSTWNAGNEVFYNGNGITPYFTPNITYINGKYFLTYVNSDHSLHIIQSTDLNSWTGQSNPAFNGHNSPTLTYFQDEGVYHLTWHATGGDTIYDAISSDAIYWIGGTSIYETSLDSIALEVAQGHFSSGFRVLLWAWTGTDGIGYGRLNVMQYDWHSGGGGGGGGCGGCHCCPNGPAVHRNEPITGGGRFDSPRLLAQGMAIAKPMR